MCADSMAKLTAALTPTILFSDFSTEPTQDEQVIPVTERFTCLVLILLSTRSLLMKIRLLLLLLPSRQNSAKAGKPCQVLIGKGRPVI